MTAGITGTPGSKELDFDRRISSIESAIRPTEISVNAGGLTLSNGWAQSDATNNPVRAINTAGVIRLRGALSAASVTTSTGNGSTAFLLPEGWRPLYAGKYATYRSVDRTNTISYVNVTTDGEVKPYFTSGDGVIGLEGIIFDTERGQI